jgi:predicted nucleotidyltransferase
MNPRDPNVAMLEMVAKALGPINDRVVYVGGCAVGLLITDLARPVVRATKDVDVFVEIGSRAKYYELSEELRHEGFVEDHEDDVICRWKLEKLQVDIMPTDPSVLGFSNKWSLPAVRDAETILLPSGRQIRLIAPAMLVATKIEAFHDRGNGSFGSSHDIEDIVNLVDGREELTSEIRAADEAVRTYLANELDDLLGQPSFIEGLAWHLGPSTEDQARVEVVIARLRQIAGL